jgi:hypothetical protein
MVDAQNKAANGRCWATRKRENKQQYQKIVRRRANNVKRLHGTTSHNHLMLLFILPPVHRFVLSIHHYREH